MHPDLFAPPLLPGLATREELIDRGEEARLIAWLETLPFAPFQFHEWQGKRQVVSFGWRYDFGKARAEPADPIPPELLPLRGAAAAFAGLEPEALVQVLINLYEPGAGIGWHRDRPIFGAVIGVSLQNDATLRFRRRRPGGFDRFALPAPPRSIYALTGEARHDWEHSIAPLPQRRWSITFRSLASRPSAGAG